MILSAAFGLILAAAPALSDITNALPEGLSPQKLTVETVLIHEPGDDWTYAHHPSLAFFNGRYHAMWSNGRKDEDAPGQRILCCSSPDFIHWTAPKPLLGPMRGKHSELVLTASGFYAHGGTLAAYAGRYEYAPEHLENGNRKPGDAAHQDTGLMVMTSTDGENWSDPKDLGIPVVPNHPPQPTRSGRLIICANVAFPYTDDPSGLGGWIMSGIYPPEMTGDLFDDSQGFRVVQRRAGWPVGLCEGSFYQTGDGVIRMLLRSGTPKLWAAESRDDGATWSQPCETGFSDDRAKFHCGQLPDGRFYQVGNAVPNGKRNPLVLSLSNDGIRFDRQFILADEDRPMKKPGLYKGGVYAYPHTLVHNGFLNVIVSVCKESVLVLRIPLEAPVLAETVDENR